MQCHRVYPVLEPKTCENESFPCSIILFDETRFQKCRYNAFSQQSLASTSLLCLWGVCNNFISVSVNKTCTLDIISFSANSCFLRKLHTSRILSSRQVKPLISVLQMTSPLEVPQRKLKLKEFSC